MDTKSSLMEKYLTPIAVLLGAAIIAFALAYGHGATSDGAAGGPAAAADISQIATEGEPFIGDANAPVAMALYFDYQCPFCKQFDQQVMPGLIEKYVESGKLKVYLKDFQFLGADSLTAAEYGRAMWDLYPDKYYDWVVAMFNAQDDEGDQGFGDEPSVVALTQGIEGVDAAKVTAQVAANKGKYDAAISASRDEGAAMGINGTPSVIVGKKLFYAMSPAQFTAAISAEIEAELK